MPDVELYWGPGSCARVPFIALEEAGADFTLHVINRFAGDAKSPEYLAVNPKGKVPTLVVDGWILTENPAIQTYIAGAYPDAALLPTCDVGRSWTRCRRWRGSPAACTPTSADCASLRTRRPTGRRRTTGSGRRPAQLEKGFAILERRLADRGVALRRLVDRGRLHVVAWFRATGSGMDGTPFPRCAEHARRNEARPAVERVLDREELEFSRFVEAGTVPGVIPPHQVGRAPDVSAQRTA